MLWQSFLPFAGSFGVNKEDQTEYLTPDTILRCFFSLFYCPTDLSMGKLAVHITALW